MRRRHPTGGDVKEARDEAQAFVGAVARLALLVDDPPRRAGLAADPDDDYLVSLANVADVDALVSGDRHVLPLHDHRPPVLTPRKFFGQLGESGVPTSIE